MNKYFPLLFLLTIAWLSAMNTAHSLEIIERYPLSMAATRDSVSRWLEENDLAFQVITTPGGPIHIRSLQPNQEWSIELTPHSPLATKLTVHVAKDTQREENFKELLQYVKDKNTLSFHTTNQQQAQIPATILDKIGTVACINANHQGETVQFSGVFIDRKGLILSTAHDLKEHEEVNIISTINTHFKGDIVKIDFDRDLALIQITTDKDQFVELEGGRNLLGMGEKVFSIGCPVGLRGTISSGFINGPPRMAKNQPIWQASMEIQPGSSGSPVFDENGAFIAIVKGRHRVSTGIGFLIPLETVIDFLNEQDKQ